MAIMNALNVSASGMTAQRLRLDIISQNIANASTTRDDNGEAYRRKTVMFAEKSADSASSFNRMLMNKTSGLSETVGNGVRVTAIVEDHVTAMKQVYDPSHPDANEEGYVTMPNVNTVTEMTNLIDATRSYEANVTAFNATKNMLLKGLEVGQ